MHNNQKIIVISIGVMATIGLFYFKFLKNTTVSTIVNNVSTSGQLSQFQLKDICHCYVVTGGMTAQAMYDSVSLQEVPTDVFPGTTSNATGYFQTTIAPSGRALVAIKENSLWYQERPGMLMRKIYTPSTGETIGLPTWSTDEQYVVLAVEVEADMQPSEGMWASALRLVRVQDGQVTSIITREQSTKQGLKNLFAFAISNNGNTIWFSSGDMMGQQLFSWSSTTKNFTSLKSVVYSPIYYSTTVVNGKSIYLAVKNNKLIRFEIDTGKESTEPFELWGDSPVSRPSPDGEHIVYYLKSQDEHSGLPTIYNLSTGAQRILTDQPLPQSMGMNQVVWSPKGDFILYTDNGIPDPHYFTLRTSQEHQTPQIVAKVPISGDLSMVYSLLPLPTIEDQQMAMAQAAGNELDFYKERHATESEAQQLMAETKNISLYKTNLIETMGGTDCGVSQRNTELRQLNSQGVQTQMVDTVFPVYSTSNTFHWTKQDLSDFSRDDTVICGVGTTTPQAILGDTILWWHSCWGGMGIEKDGSKQYLDQIRCLRSEEVINTHFANIK